MRKKLIYALVSVFIIITIFLIAMECKYSDGRIVLYVGCVPGRIETFYYGRRGEKYDVTVKFTGSIISGKLTIYVIDGLEASIEDEEENILETIILDKCGEFEKIIDIGEVSPNNVKTIKIVCTGEIDSEETIGTCRMEYTSKIKGWDKFFDDDISEFKTIGE